MAFQLCVCHVFTAAADHYYYNSGDYFVNEIVS